MSELILGLAWPVLALLAGIFFYRKLTRILTAVTINIEKGAPVSAGSWGIGAPPVLDQVKVNQSLTEAAHQSGGELLSDANIALFHTSFWRADKSKEFDQKMYQIEVIVVGPDAALNEIQNVSYSLDPAYRERAHRKIESRSDRFKLKELANGYSIVRAEIRFKGRQEVLRLNRFIDLSDAGPRV